MKLARCANHDRDECELCGTYALVGENHYLTDEGRKHLREYCAEYRQWVAWADALFSEPEASEPPAPLTGGDAIAVADKLAIIVPSLLDEIERLSAHAPPAAVKASAWYMHDNFTFTRLTGSIDQIIADAKELVRKSPYGMLCPVTLLDMSGQEIRRVGKSVHVPYGAREFSDADIDAWRALVLADVDAKRLLQVPSPMEACAK